MGRYPKRSIELKPSRAKSIFAGESSAYASYYVLKTLEEIRDELEKINALLRTRKIPALQTRAHR